jgi:hypothetical protein
VRGLAQGMRAVALSELDALRALPSEAFRTRISQLLESRRQVRARLRPAGALSNRAAAPVCMSARLSAFELEEWDPPPPKKKKKTAIRFGWCRHELSAGAVVLLHEFLRVHTAFTPHTHFASGKARSFGREMAAEPPFRNRCHTNASLKPIWYTWSYLAHEDIGLAE